jgi:hypothetical protein
MYDDDALTYSMISDFADRTTEDIFHGLDTKPARKIPQGIWPVAARNLDMVNAAHDLGDSIGWLPNAPVHRRRVAPVAATACSVTIPALEGSFESCRPRQERSGQT